MVIPYGDLIAARNAATHLVTILRDPMDPPSDYQKNSIKAGVRIAVPRDRETYAFGLRRGRAVAHSENRSAP